MARYKNIGVTPDLHDRIFKLAAANKTSPGIYASDVLTKHADKEEKRKSRRRKNVATL